MINIHFEGYKYGHDIYELIKLFFPSQEQKEITNLNEYKEGYLLKFSLNSLDNKHYGLTQIYLQGELVAQSRKSMDQVSIYRKEDKSIRVGVKQSIYDALVELTGDKMPWGILSGIRPIKLVHDLMDKKINTKEIFDILNDEYRLSEENSNLIIDIAKRQSSYLNNLPAKSYSLYIGIPFCPTRCSYCSFPAFSLNRYGHLIEDYIDSLLREIRFIKELMNDYKINTVYIGGGTPTALPLKSLERILKALEDLYGIKNIAEFTVEAGRPDTINKEIIGLLKNSQVDRISINPQTMNEKTLKAIGRNHSPRDIVKAYELSKGLGIESINMDLIVGLPGEGVSEINHTLEELSLMDPENITVHTLAIKRGSKLANNKYEDIIIEDNNIKAMIEKTKSMAYDMAMKPYYLYRQKHIAGNYENIGYAKEGYECKYNISIMEEKETIMAAGVGSVSKIYYPGRQDFERVPNFKDINQYNTRLEELFDLKRNIINSELK